MNARNMMVLLLLPLLFIIGCENPTDLDPGYELGDFQLRDKGPAGGLIFYIDEADEFDWTFLEAAPQSTEWADKQWGDYNTEIGGNAGLNGIGDGRAATEAVVAHMNSKGITGTAAQLCDALSHNGFVDANHWSSSESDKQFAKGHHFGLNSAGGIAKYEFFRVRAVRAF
jgi:hypothetical protein